VWDVCRHCNKIFCSTHIKCLIATNQEEIDALAKSAEKDKYKKYFEDWKRTDGHPCLTYTVWWNEQRRSFEESTKKTDVTAPKPVKKQGLLQNIKDALGIL